jgi:hypothetical protein
MDYQLLPDPGFPVVECTSGITDSRDALELAYVCSGAGTDLLLLGACALPSGFFQLRTGFAGEFVQKLVDFRLRTAAVFPPEVCYPRTFQEFLLEARRGRHFRACETRGQALAWLEARGAP